MRPLKKSSNLKIIYAEIIYKLCYKNVDHFHDYVKFKYLNFLTFFFFKKLLRE